MGRGDQDPQLEQTHAQYSMHYCVVRHWETSSRVQLTPLVLLRTKISWTKSSIYNSKHLIYHLQ